MEKEYCLNNAGAAMPIPWNGLNLVTSDPNVDHYYAHLESTLSSIMSSPAPTANDPFALRGLVAKQLGGGVVSPTPNPLFPPILDHVGSWGNSPPPPVPSAACDPIFAGRVEKFSCFGSRSFNGRTTMVGTAELSNRSDHLPPENERLPRVSSSPALKNGGSPSEIKNTSQLQMGSNGILMGSDKKSSSNEESSVSELVMDGEMDLKKRKAVYRSNEGEDEGGGLKRSKATESAKTGPTNDDSDQKQKANQKPAEPPKDYIHVRARRGQATDSHSLAERVRREKISERMKLLQDLVPGCNKVTGKALMLDEIINYVQSLQRQVEFLSMKLATVNPGLDFNMASKEVFQENGTLQQQMYNRIDNDTSSAAFYNHHHQQHQNVQQPLHDNANASSVDPVGIQFPSLNGFSEFPAFGEDELQSIVHMGFPVIDQTTDVKIEL